MNRYIHKSFIYLLCTLLLSCTQSEVGSYGYLTVGVTDEVNADVQVKAGEEEVEEDDVAVPEAFKIQVVDADGNVDAEIEDHKTITAESPIALLMGKYTVKASSGNPASGFNEDYSSWYGESSVRIFSEKSASVNIVAKISKVIFTVSFPTDEEFQKMFPSYSLAVKSGEGDKSETLTFSNTAAVGQGAFTDVAYFVVPENKKLTYTLTMKNKDGAQYTSTQTIDNVAAAEHYHFEFSLGEREEIDGALVLNISLDGEFKEQVLHDLNLNFDKTQMPSYTHNPEFDPEAEGIVYPLGNEVTKKLTFLAPRGIKSLIVSHMDYNLLLEGLPQVTDFVNISAADNKKMTDLGIVGSANKEDLEGSIDITEFIKNLVISPENTSYQMSFTVIDMYDRYARCDFRFTIVSDIQAETVSAFTWSSFSILKGRYFSKTPPAGVSFQYKKKADADWVEIDPSLMKVDNATMTYSYLLNNLDVNTSYLFRSTSNKDKADGKVAADIEFTTLASESSLYNLSFDDWYKDGKVWYPRSEQSQDYVWDTANKAAASLGKSPTTPEESVVVKGKAVRMESMEIMGVLAAGNVYTGKFGSIEGIGAKLKWGYPFTSRPLALRGWYRYEPKPIDIVGSGYDHLRGKADICQIQIFLTDWTSQFEINTTSGTFVDLSENNKSIIAHGEIQSDDNTTDNQDNNKGYIKFTIPLVYRNMNQPSYIVVAGAASRYGDYFTGGLGSVLYLDELELVYDPTELTDAEFEKVFGRIRK